VDEAVNAHLGQKEVKEATDLSARLAVAETWILNCFELK